MGNQKESRVCKKCGQNKPLGEFSRRSDNGLYRHVCRECMRARSRERHAQQRAAILAEREQYERDHPITSIVCSICHENKPLSEYRRRKDTGKYRSECIECQRQRCRDYHKEHRAEQLEKMREYGKKWRSDPENKERLALQSKEWYEKNKQKIREHRRENGRRYYYDNRERELERHRIYSAENRGKINASQRAYRSKRMRNDPVFKLKLQARTLAWSALMAKGYKKNTKTEKLVGCTIDELITHLLKTYKENYGEEWDGKEPVHIDHIKPLASVKTERETIELFHYSNLQLLKAHDNLVKHDSLDWQLGNEDDKYGLI